MKVDRHGSCLEQLAFIHIPKTAGLSLHSALEDHYGKDFTLRIGTDEFHANFLNMSKDEIRKYRFVSGHVTLPQVINKGIDYPMISVIRNPLDRLVSLMEYLTQSDRPDHNDFMFDSVESFAQHMSNNGQYNLQCWQLSDSCDNYQDAVDMIMRHHVFVAPLEYYDDFLGTLSGLIGKRLKKVWENVTPNGKNIGITDEDRRLLDSFIVEDWKLYKFVTKNYQQIKENFLKNAYRGSKSAKTPDIDILRSGEKQQSGTVLGKNEKRQTLLFVDYAVPHYDMFAGSRTNFMYLSLLVEMGLNVKFLPADFKRVEPYSSQLNALWIETLDGEWYRNNWENWLRDEGQKIDYVFFHKPDPAMKFLEAVKRYTSAGIIYQCHDLHSLRLQREAKINEDKRLLTEASLHVKKEDFIFSGSDVLLTFSEEEEKIIKRRFPYKQVFTVPLFFYETLPATDRDFRKRQDLLFVGGCDHAPNRDAVSWFCAEVLCLIRQQIPEIVFNVVGANPPRDILALQSKNVRILGKVSEEKLKELYAAVRLAVIPLRFGAGVKGKTMEALYHGVPVVSTSIGLEGIRGIDRIFAAQDDPAGFAAQVVSLYKDEKRLEELSELGSAFIAETFTKQKTAELMGNILSSARKEVVTEVSVLPASAAPREIPRLIAFYLPQYYPIPENNEWWGEGFTEWRNVAKANPLFPGHYQPHIPADLGFYDLRLEETRVAQAQLASEYGIYGFCYYHYWFTGKMLLERPLNDMLKSGKPDFPFCICWANENWTRRWDGEDQQVLMRVEYSEEDDRRHIRELFGVFQDDRYIRISGKPLFLVYRTENIPDPGRTAKVWREEAREAGIGELYLVRVESVGQTDPRAIGFDAALEFAPDWNNKGSRVRARNENTIEKRFNLEIPKDLCDKNYVHYYDELANNMMKKPAPDYKWFRCVTPSWDNTARRLEGAHIFLGSTPESYQDWLKQAIEFTLTWLNGDERIVFVNAWNEWAEGNHLEPDQKFGRSYLEATSQTLQGTTHTTGTPSHLAGQQSTPLLLIEKLLTNRKRKISLLERQIAAKDISIEDRQLDIEKRETSINQILESVSWRITEPLRRAHEIISKLIQKGRG